jgi:hypothetical protein
MTEKLKKINEYSVYDKFWYEIQEQKKVLVWCIGIYWPISSTGCVRIFSSNLAVFTYTHFLNV